MCSSQRLPGTSASLSAATTDSSGERLGERGQVAVELREPVGARGGGAHGHELDPRAIEAALAVGHRPVGHALVEVGRAEAHEYRVDELVDRSGVEVLPGDERGVSGDGGRDVGPSGGHRERGPPEVAVGDDVGVLREEPAQHGLRGDGGVGEHRRPLEAPRAPEARPQRPVLGAPLSQGLVEVGVGDAPGLAQRAEGVLIEVAAGVVGLAALRDRLVEGELLEGVQGVVVDEHRDRPLVREQVRGVREGRADPPDLRGRHGLRRGAFGEVEHGGWSYGMENGANGSGASLQAGSSRLRRAARGCAESPRC